MTAHGGGREAREKAPFPASARQGIPSRSTLPRAQALQDPAQMIGVKLEVPPCYPPSVSARKRMAISGPLASCSCLKNTNALVHF